MEILTNASARPVVDLDGFTPPDREPMALHHRLPGYEVTPLVEAPVIADRLGVVSVLIKDEARRLDLPSYKILGASYAIMRRLAETGLPTAGWSDLDALRARLAGTERTLVAATDGNHGRAVARVARLLGFAARIYVPDDMVPARIAAIESEGAEVVVVDGSYDDAVDLAGAQEDAMTVVIADTAYEGYVDVPRWVSEGYSTIFWEVDDAVHDRGLSTPTVVAVQMGVGALAAAAVRCLRWEGRGARPRLIGVEPTGSHCVLEAVRAGSLVEVPGPHRSIMSGLNCGRASAVALPLLRQGLDVLVAVEDERSREAMRLLAAVGVTAGEAGAAGLAGLLALADAGEGLVPDDHVLVLNTEGATDPEAYRRIVGSR